MKRDQLKSKKHLRGIAFLTLPVFFASSIFFASPAEIFAREFPISVSTRLTEGFLRLPAALGKFDRLFSPLSGNQSVFFLHIKDAHASREAQWNIAGILARLRDRKQLDLVLIEGTAGTPMPGRLDPFKDAKMNASYKNDLFKAGLMNGAAYFIASEKGVPSGGLENPRVYFNQVQIFKRVVEARRNSGKFFDTIEAVMLNTFKNVLRADIFLFLREWRLQQQKEMSWGHYLPFLIRSAEKFLSLDLSDYHAQISWPNLVRFRYLSVLEETIRPEAVKGEFRRLLSALSGDRSPALEQAMTLLSVAVENPVSMIQETPDFRRYAEALVDACRRNGVLLQEYPNLVRYLAFRIFRSEIEPEGMLAEAERLEEAVFDKLFTNGKMRKVISAYKDFYALKRAFRLELDRAESNRFLAMDVEKRIRQFPKIAPGYDLAAEEVIEGAKAVREFYQIAQKRDDVFVKQIKDRLRETRVLPDRPFFIAIVTGGYHAEGLENWLRSEGLPFAGIQPSFRDEPDTDRYEKLLVGDYRSADALATAQGSITPDAIAKKLMGHDDFQAFRSAEADVLAKYSAVLSRGTRSSKVARPEVRSGELKPVSEMNRRRFLTLAGTALAGLVSGCATVSHTELKKTLRSAEEYSLPRKPVALLPVTHVDSGLLLRKILENDPKVKKAEIEIAIKEIEKDRLKGSWSIFTEVALVDGKPVFSGGLGAAIPYVVEGGVAGYGVGSLATLAVNLAASLGSILRGEPMLAGALAEKITQMAQLNHQKVIGERYAYYAGIALEIRELRALYETAQKAIRALEPAMAAAQGRVEASDLERMKIRNIQSGWKLKADEYRSSLKAKEALLANLFAPGMTAETEFVIDLRENTLPQDWKADPGIIERLRHDATNKSGKQPPPSRELAVAYKGREAAVIVRELEHARGRFSLGFGGFSFIDNLGSPSRMSSSTKGDLGTAWDSGLDRRTKDRTAGGLKGQISFGKSIDVEERVSSKKVEITDSVLTDVQRTVEDDISGLVYRMGKNQDKIRTLAGELQRLENDIRRARQARVAGRRLVTEDKLAEYVSEAWKCRMGLIEARAEVNKAILKLEAIAGVLGELSWRNAGGSRSEFRGVKIPAKDLAVIAGTAGFWGMMAGLLPVFRTHLSGNNAFPGTVPRVIEKMHRPAFERGFEAGPDAGSRLPVSGIAVEKPGTMADSPRSKIRGDPKTGSAGKSFFPGLKPLIGVMVLFVSLVTGAFAGTPEADMKGAGTGASAGIELRSGDVGTELGNAYEMYDDFTTRILNTIPEGGGKKDIRRFAEILRVTIVSEETLRQAQQLFVREVVSQESAGTIKAAVVSGPSAIGAGLVKAAAADSRTDDEISTGGEADHNEESALAIKRLDDELGRAVPGFKKHLKNPESDPATIEGYRKAVLNAILTARLVNPEDTVDPSSFQKVFFNWDNPFHSAWNHRDAMERSVAKGRVIVNPAFRDRIQGLADRAGVLDSGRASMLSASESSVVQPAGDGSVAGLTDMGADVAAENENRAVSREEPAINENNPLNRKLKEKGEASYEEKEPFATGAPGDPGVEKTGRETTHASSRHLVSRAPRPDVSHGGTSGHAFQEALREEPAPAGTTAKQSVEPVVGDSRSASVKHQVLLLGPGSADSTQLPAPASRNQSAGLSPVMQILLGGTSGTAEIPHDVEVSESSLPEAASSDDPSLPEIGGEERPVPVSAASSPRTPPVVPGEPTASSVAHQPASEATVSVPTIAGGGVTNPASAINNATNALPLAGTVSAGASLAAPPPVPETSQESPVAVSAPETGSTGGSVFNGKTAVNPVLLNLSAPLSGIPEYAVKEGDMVSSGDVILKIMDPENASRIRTLIAEIALIDAQLADGSVNAAEYTNLQFEKESLERELRERNYQEAIRTLKASHPLKIVKLARGQVNQGDVAVYGVELDAGQISFRLPIENADFDNAELQVNGETVWVLRYDLGDFDPVSGQFLLTIDFVSPSGARHDSQITYSLRLDRRREQGMSDPPLGAGKPFHVMVSPRESASVTVPVAPGVPGGVFHALVPEGAVVPAGTPVGFIDVSGYRQEQLAAARGLQKLVDEMSAANRDFAAVSPEELRKLNAEAGLRIASLEGVNPEIVIRAPVAGRVTGLIPAEGQTVIPGRATGIRILSSLVFLGSTDLSDSDHLIDVPKGSVREGERVRVRTPLGDVLDGTVFKVHPLADENGLWLSDRDALVVQVEDPDGKLGDNMPVEIWTGIPAPEKGETPAPSAGPAALPLHYGSDLPPAVLFQLLRHPDRNLSGSVRSVLAGEGSFRQILSSWKYFFGSAKGMASFGDMIRTGLSLAIGSIVSLWAGTKIARSLKQKLKSLDPRGRLNDLVVETRELQIRLEQKGQAQDKELLEDVITSINGWISILADARDFDRESLGTILIKAQELAGNKHLAFSKMKFQDLGMWKDGIGDDLAAIYGILTVLSILTARRITVQSRKKSSKAPMVLHELHRFQQGIVDYGDIFNVSYALAHHLIGMSQTMDLFPPKVVRGLKSLSFFDSLKILHNRLVRFLYPVVRVWLWVSPVVFLHKMNTLRSYCSLGRKMERLGLNTPEDTKRDVMNAKQGLTYALNSQVTLNQPAGSKMAMHYGRFWRRFITILGISSLFLPTVVLSFLGLHWLTATTLMSVGKIILPFAAIGFHIVPILTNFSGKYHNVWNRELAGLRRKNARAGRSLPELPKPQAVPKNSTTVAMPRQGSEQIAMSKVLNALHESAQDPDLEVVALVPPQYGENKTALERLIQNDALLRRWVITVAESDGEFPGDAGLFYAARNIAKTSQRKFRIYWYPQAGIDFRAALSVFKINLGEAARMIGDLRTAGVLFGEVAFPGGNLVSSSVGITKNGGHFVVQARHASLNEIENERLPALLGRNGTSRLEIEHVIYDLQQLRQMMAAGPLRLGSGRVDLGNAALPQIPVPTGPIAIVAETPEENQTIRELLDKTDEKVRNLIGRFGPFRINFLEDIVRPAAELSGQVTKGSATPPNPNLLVNRTVRLSDDSVVSPYDKLYTALSRFLWNRGKGNRRDLKAEAFIPPVSETVYVSGEDPQKLSQALGRVAADFPELVDRKLSQKLTEEGPAGTGAKLVFRDDAGRTVFEKKKQGYRRGLRSRDVAGFVIKDRMIALQRRDHQVWNEPGRLDVSFAGHQDETDQGPEAAAVREFHEELLGGRRPVPEGVVFRPVGSPVQLEITHESEQGLSVRRKDTVVYRVSLDSDFSRDDFLPGDNAAEIVWMPREELETALEQTPGLFTARAFQLFTKLGPAVAFSEGGGRSEIRVAHTKPGIRIPPAVISLPRASAVSLQYDRKINPVPRMSRQIRILTAILVTQKILAARDAGLLPELEASLRDAARVAERVAPALASLSGAHDVSIGELRAGLAAVLRQEQTGIFADDRVVFLDAGTIPEEYFGKIAISPFPVVILFDRDHKALYDRVTKESPRAKNIFPVYAPDGINSFIRNSLRSGAAAVTASPRLNGILTRFREQGKSEDIALITGSRAESQKIEQDYVGHRYYFTNEMLHLDPELVAYSLMLLLRSPELFRYGKGRYAQDVISLIGLVLQQLAQEYEARLRTGSAA